MPFPGISGIWPIQNPLNPVRQRTFNAQFAAGGMTVINVFFGLTTGTQKTAIRITNNSTSNLSLNGVWIGPQIAIGQPYSFGAAPTLVTWNGGNSAVTVSPSQSLTSDELDYAIPSTLVIAANVLGTLPTATFASAVGGLPQSKNLTYASYSSTGCRIRSCTRNSTTGVITFTTTQVGSTTALPHNLAVNNAFYFGNGTITGLSPETIYYVNSVPATNTFTLSTTPGGAAFTAAVNPTITGIVYLCPQIASYQVKPAGYPPVILAGSAPNNATQSIFSAVLTRNI